MKWYLTVVLICVYLMTSGIEHLFMYLLVIYISSLEKCLFKSVAYFLIEVFGFLLLSCVCFFCNRFNMKNHSQLMAH